MTREEAYEIARQMGAHPYSIDAMTDALMKGCEIGKQEQKSKDINNACLVYNAELRAIVRCVNALREGVGDCISIEGSVKDFRKALEDKK